MALSFNQKLAYILGYSAKDFDARYTTMPLNIPNFSADDISELQAVIDKLEVIDNAIAQNTQDSMAVKIDSVTVDFHQNIQIMKIEGSRLLNRLSQLSGVPVRYDQYLGRSSSEGSKTHPLSVTNYA